MKCYYQFTTAANFISWLNSMNNPDIKPHVNTLVFHPFILHPSSFIFTLRPSPFLSSPSSFILHPSSSPFILHPSSFTLLSPFPSFHCPSSHPSTYLFQEAAFFLKNFLIFAGSDRNQLNAMTTAQVFIEGG